MVLLPKASNFKMEFNKQGTRNGAGQHKASYRNEDINEMVTNEAVPVNYKENRKGGLRMHKPQQNNSM